MQTSKEVPYHKPVQPTTHRLQKHFADYIEDECMTGDHEDACERAQEAVMKYLDAISCDDLVKAWKAAKRRL